MSDIEVDEAASGWATAVAQLASTQAGGFSHHGPHGTWELVTCGAVPLADGIVSTFPSADPGEVSRFAGSPRLRPVAWSIQVRDEVPDPAITRIAAEAGRSARFSRFFLVKALGSDEAAVDPSTARTWAVSGADDPPVLLSRAGSPRAPAGLLSMLPAPSVLGHPAVRGHVVEVEGEPVGAVLSVRVDDMVGIYDLSAAAHLPHDGLSEAATTAALSDAALDGARIAFVHAAPPSLLFYLDLGFRHVETWTVFGP